MNSSTGRHIYKSVKKMTRADKRVFMEDLAREAAGRGEQGRV